MPLHNPTRKLAFTAALLFSAALAGAQQRPCTHADAQSADAQIDDLHKWNDLYRFYASYRQCDDGVVSEGYSQAVARILLDHWATLHRLADLAKEHPRFGHFVLKHVDATLDPNDLKRIHENAVKRCPPGLNTICADLKKQSEAGLKMDAALGIK